MDSIPPTATNDGEVVAPSTVDPFLVEALQNPRHRLTSNLRFLYHSNLFGYTEIGSFVLC